MYSNEIKLLALDQCAFGYYQPQGIIVSREIDEIIYKRTPKRPDANAAASLDSILQIKMGSLTR